MAVTEYWFEPSSGAPSPQRVAGRETVLSYATRGGSGWATSVRVSRPVDSEPGESAAAVLGTVDQLAATLDRAGVELPPLIRALGPGRETDVATALHRHPADVAAVSIAGVPQLMLTWIDAGWTAGVALVDGTWVGLLCHGTVRQLVAV